MKNICYRGKYSIGSYTTFILLYFLLVFTPNQAFGQHKTFLWKIQSDGNTAYVLGSIHFMKQDSYPLDKRIEDAFEASDVLAVEANVNDITKINLQKLLETAFYPENETLEDHVSGQTYEQVKKAAEDSGLPLLLLSRQRPWFIALTFTSMELLKQGLDPSYGIDLHFLTKASGQKKIVELENLDSQIDLLSGFTDTEQEAFLLHTLDELKTSTENVEKLIRAWETGDLQRMESLTTEGLRMSSGMSSVYEKLIYERNRRMVSKIQDFLGTGDTYFVVIGAGHLVGEEGIIKLLEKKGYCAEQI